jgi:hypothetical protein
MKMIEIIIHLLGILLIPIRSRDSVVGVATGYGMDDRGVGIRVWIESRIFFLVHVVQTGFEAQPTSYTMGTGGSFSGVKQGNA